MEESPREKERGIRSNPVDFVLSTMKIQEKVFFDFKGADGMYLSDHSMRICSLTQNETRNAEMMFAGKKVRGSDIRKAIRKVISDPTRITKNDNLKKKKLISISQNLATEVLRIRQRRIDAGENQCDLMERKDVKTIRNIFSLNQNTNLTQQDFRRIREYVDFFKVKCKRDGSIMNRAIAEGKVVTGTELSELLLEHLERVVRTKEITTEIQ